MRQERNIVEYLAGLARIDLTPAERASLHDGLARMLEYVALLDTVDVSEVPPTTHGGPISLRLRDDEPGPALPQPTVLALAPHPAAPYVATTRAHPLPDSGQHGTFDVPGDGETP